MTEDLTPKRGRAFVGYPTGHGALQVVTIMSVRHRHDGTPSSCKVIWESPGVGGEPVVADATLTLAKDGLMHGFRRVTAAQVGIANEVAENTGKTVPADAVCIVTRDRTGGGHVWKT